MAPTHELLVIQAENRVVRIEEVGVENDLDAVMRRVEELDTANLVEDGVGRVIVHVVRDHRREGVPLERKDAAL